MLQLTGELDAGRMSVKDLEQKVSLLERSSVASKDTLLRGMQERYEKEILTLRNQIESITAKLSAKVCAKATYIACFPTNVEVFVETQAGII